jgi:MFS family permease
MGGCLIGTFGGLILHLIPGTILVIFSGVCWIIAPLLFAIAPKGANYWAWVFTSMTCATLGIDITFNVTTIFITTSLPSSQQGLAGALINSIMQLAIAVCLGISAIIAKATSNKGLRQSYQAVFWFEVACAALALAILVLFVKIKSATAELTRDERIEMRVLGDIEGMATADQVPIPQNYDTAKPAPKESSSTVIENKPTS